MAGTTSLIIEGKFDVEMIQMFQELRQIRLEVLKEQLRSSDVIASKFEKYTSEKKSFEEEEIVKLLTAKITCLEQRLAKGNAIYADELDLFMELLNER